MKIYSIDFGSEGKPIVCRLTEADIYILLSLVFCFGVVVGVYMFSIMSGVLS